ncbi:hypothetical protein J7M28_12655 [bacterium]|nr:hypothetical protein [bacterium]
MRAFPVALIILLISCSGLAFAEGPDLHEMQKELAKRWQAVDFEYSVSFEDYLSSRIVRETEVLSVLPHPCPLLGESSGRILVLVNSKLYPQIEANLQVLAVDINAEGFSVVLAQATFETPQDLRASLVEAWESDEGLAGCLLIGDFPVPWFCIYGDTPGEDDEDFPCDLYYEDLDGEFIDTTADGMFDEHTDGSGDVMPDIFLGRLTASPLTLFDEAEHVNRYLLRNHEYRTGQLDVPPHRALLFIDDDWADSASWWEDAVGRLYDDIKVITDVRRTNAEEYSKQLSEGYEWIDVMVHSGPEAHYFSYYDASSVFYNEELAVHEVNALFFVPFACSNARYVEPDYFGAYYIFGENTKGLCSIGSTKSGSLMYGDLMYQKMSEGHCIGESFKAWFADVAPYDEEDVSWFYGLTLLGDPTLHPPDTGPPAPPWRLRCTENDEGDGIILTWEASEADDLAGYKLYYDTTGYYPPFKGEGLPQGDSPIDVGDATSISITYEEIGEIEELNFAVTAYDVRGNESDYSRPTSDSGNPSRNAPVVAWVYQDPNESISYEEGGTFCLNAYILDEEDRPGSLHVELLLDSVPTGLLLYDDGTHGDYYAADTFYTCEVDVPPHFLDSGSYLVSIVATDCDGNRSNEWPFVEIPDDSAGDTSPVPGRARSTPDALVPNWRIAKPDSKDDQAPFIANSWIACTEFHSEQLIQIAFQVYHPLSEDNVVSVEMFFGGYPTGEFLTKNDEYSSNKYAYFYDYWYASEVGLGPGKYLLEAVATDVDGNESPLFPYIYVE